MPDIDELRREAEETKERLKRDILDLRDILRKIAQEGGERSHSLAADYYQLAERQIDEAVTQAENRVESALAAVMGCNLSYDDFITRRLDCGDFTQVEVDCAFHVEITQADICHASIWASEEIQDKVNAIKSGNTLKLSLQSLNLRARPIVHVRIQMPELYKIRLGGISQGTVSGFKAARSLDMNLSGNSTLVINVEATTVKGEISGASRLAGTIKTDSTELVLSGASRVQLSGSARNLLLNSWGAAKAEIENLVAKNADIRLKGASEASVNVTDKLITDLTSGSKLTYAGNPTVETVSVTGASSLQRK